METKLLETTLTFSAIHRFPFHCNLQCFFLRQNDDGEKKYLGIEIKCEYLNRKNKNKTLC